MRRAKGSGSLFERKGRWAFVVELPPEDGARRRRTFYGPTADAAEAKARAEFPDLRPPSLDRPRPRNWAERKALAKSQGGTHSRQQWWFKVRRAEWRCYYCGVDTRLPGVTLNKDHMTPICRGGSDALDNVVPSCRACNVAKGTRTVEEYVGKDWRGYAQ